MAYFKVKVKVKLEFLWQILFRLKESFQNIYTFIGLKSKIKKSRGGATPPPLKCTIQDFIFDRSKRIRLFAIKLFSTKINCPVEDVYFFNDQTYLYSSEHIFYKPKLTVQIRTCIFLLIYNNYTVQNTISLNQN